MSKLNKWPEKETDLAAVVVDWLLGLGYEVYQEVRLYQGGPIADIVAVIGKRYWVVECKKTLGLSVMDQAMEWLYYAHYVSVAVPNGKGRNYKSGIVSKILNWQGIGCLCCSKQENHYKKALVDGKFSWEKDGIDIDRSVRENIRPRLNRKILGSYIGKALYEEQKTYCSAGSKEGYYTPFKATCERIVGAVKKKPGITVKELLNTIDTHYQSTATARNCIYKYLRNGVVKGVRLDDSTRPARIYLNSIEDELQ